MKKIIVTIDAINYNEYALQYATDIAKQSGGMVLGVFLHDISYIYADLPGIFDLVPVEYNNIIKKQHDDYDKQHENMQKFNNFCNTAGVTHKVHFHDSTNIVDFLVKESVFADVLVLDSQMSFAIHPSNQLSNFISDVLEEAHCPVLVVPNVSYTTIDNVYLCYDGSPSSVKAIKMFSYLFPEWKSKNTTLVTFNENSSQHLANSENIKDLLHQHFKDLKIDIEHAKRQHDGMLNFFKLKEENTIIVMGAYGRNPFSRLIKKSAANTIITNTKSLVFITHE